MTHLLFAVGAAESNPEWLDASLRRYESFKGLELSRYRRHEGSLLGFAGRKAGAGGNGHVVHDGAWVGWAGTWVHPEADPGDPAGWLANAWSTLGASRLGRELTGQFALFRVARDGRSIEVITDRCGSLHVFERRCASGLRVSVSSAAIGDPDDLDPESVHEFVATGNVYGLRTLWRGVRKLPPASVCLLTCRESRVEPYWTFGNLAFGRDSLGASVERLHGTIANECRAISRLYPRLLTDLTGGYDSRLLLSGLLSSGAAFCSTVTGNGDDADVRVAAALAGACGIEHHTVPRTEPADAAGFREAVRLADAEADAFEYAGIASVHARSATSFSASVGGSFGEIARGYWWELLWPRIGRREPLEARMLAERRFGAIPYDAGVFSAQARLDLGNHLEIEIARSLAGLSALPNTAQMDWVYFSLRMHRWQGRLTSCTTQLRACLSPLAAGPVLEAMLEARPDSRIRSRLVRELFARYHPTLASIPLEHGYCPRPFRWSHPGDHWPLAAYYLQRVRAKVNSVVSSRIGGAVAGASVRPVPLVEKYRSLFADGVDRLVEGSALLNSGLFDESGLKRFLDPGRTIGGHALQQWHRLVTLEQGLRLMVSAKE